jgi:hypothetical protein
MRFKIQLIRKTLTKKFQSLNLSHLLIFQLLFTLFSIFQIWIFQYRSDDGNPDLIGRISFRVIDPPFAYNPENLTPIIYKHFFGDWQNLIDVARQADPYLLSNGPSQTPPLGNMFLSAISILGMKYSYFIFLGATLLVWIWLFRKATQIYPVLYSILAVSLYFILTLPAIYSFDRGSLHIFAVGIIGIAWWKYLEKRYLFAVAFFILAVSMKPQLSIFLLLLLFQRDFRGILRAILATVSTNIVLLFLFFDQPFRSAIGFLNGTSFFASANSGGYILDSASLMGFISRRIESNNGTDFALKWMTEQSMFLMAPSVILILIITPTIFFSKINQRVKIFLILSLFSLVIPASMHYTLTWASLAVIPFLSNHFNSNSKHYEGCVQNEKKGRGKDRKSISSIFTNWHISDFLSLLTITLILSPSFAVYSTGIRNTSIIRDLYPILIFAVIIIVYVENFLIQSIEKRKIKKLEENSH